MTSQCGENGQLPVYYFTQIEESLMRPQQQNRRMRGRNNGGNGGNNNNNNNRKGPNPLTRNYESNGPDVKIRGSAQQIAEKYATLARDAQSSGDRVMAENYLQHAEHYNRIIAAAQAQFAPQQIQTTRDDLDDDGDDTGYTFENSISGAIENQPSQVGMSQPVGGSGPQPVIEGMPAEVALSNDAGGQGEQPHDNRRRHRDRRHPPRQRASAGYDNAPAGSFESAPVEENGFANGNVAPVVEPEAIVVSDVEPAARSFDSEPQEQEAPRRARRPRRERPRAAAEPSLDFDGEAPATSEPAEG